MFKSVIAGFLLGIVGTAAGLHFVPVVDQHRERSMIEVAPNGGNTEVFHVNVPIDRIMVGAPGRAKPMPAGLHWPADSRLGDVRAELFKIRNSRDVVVGVASRVAAGRDGTNDVVEWTLHLPARGSIFLTMRPVPTAAGYRGGTYRAGTRDFAELSGQASERWVAAPTAEDGLDGRIDLVTALVARGGRSP